MTTPNTVMSPSQYQKIAQRIRARQQNSVVESRTTESQESGVVLGYTDVNTFIDHMQRGIRP